MPQRSIRSVIQKQKVFTSPPQATIFQVACEMKELGLGTVLVVVDKRLVGIFTERDVLYRVVAEGRDPQMTRLEQVMTRDPQTIGPDKPLGHALHMMYDGNFRHMPVVENGIPLGVISVRDALSPEMAEFESDLKSRSLIAEILG